MYIWKKNICGFNFFFILLLLLDSYSHSLIYYKNYAHTQLNGIWFEFQFHSVLFSFFLWKKNNTMYTEIETEEIFQWFVPTHWWGINIYTLCILIAGLFAYIQKYCSCMTHNLCVCVCLVCVLSLTISFISIDEEKMKLNKYTQNKLVMSLCAYVCLLSICSMGKV